DRLNSIATIIEKLLSSLTWAVIEDVIWRKTCLATRPRRLLSIRYFLSASSRRAFLRWPGLLLLIFNFGKMQISKAWATGLGQRDTGTSIAKLTKARVACHY